MVAYELKEYEQERSEIYTKAAMTMRNNWLQVASGLRPTAP